MSWQYPISEFLSGLIVAVVPWAVARAFFVGVPLAHASPLSYYALATVFTAAALILLLIALIDLRLSIIPDQCVIAIGALGIAAAGVIAATGLFGEFSGSFVSHYAALAGMRANVWVNRIAAAVIGFGFFAAIVAVTRGRGMGIGDVKLALALGLLLGWPDVAPALLLSFIIGAAWSIVGMVRGRVRLKSAVPFGPFMVLGALLVIVFGTRLMDAYFALFP